MINRTECEAREKQDVLVDMKKKKTLVQMILLVIFVVGLILSTIDISSEANLGETTQQVLEEVQAGISVVAILAAFGILAAGIYFRTREKQVVSDFEKRH